MYECDKAGRDCSAMWLKLARELRAGALRKLEQGFPDSAVRMTRQADACFWQATGEGESISLRDLFPSEGASS